MGNLIFMAKILGDLHDQGLSKLTFEFGQWLQTPGAEKIINDLNELMRQNGVPFQIVKTVPGRR